MDKVGHELIVITSGGPAYYKDISEYTRVLTAEDIAQLKCHEHKLIKPEVLPCNNNFIQQKMQGKRRVY
ncbi:MAG: hypothetical protein GY787_16480 [Alteromonadales bacterium]|nr:hypothetical protein [Alteromonadales bacterium]